MLTYQNDKKLKKELVAEMRLHKKQDQFIKGTYSRMNGVFKGCAVGCAVDSLKRKRNVEIDYNDHAGLASYLGWGEWLERLHDLFFENLPKPENQDFAIDLLEAVPVGVNIEPVKWKFCVFILKENIERVLALKHISDEIKKQVVDAIRGVLALHESAITSGKWDESAAKSAASAAKSAASAAWSAESAAWSAAKSAASAAWSAEGAAWSAEGAAWSAEGAAMSAAWSAASAAWSAEGAAWSAEGAAWSAEGAAMSAAWSAESAAYKKYAKELLRLLREEKTK